MLGVERGRQPLLAEVEGQRGQEQLEPEAHAGVVGRHGHPLDRPEAIEQGVERR
jgi:hypothetical protein